LHGPSQNPPNWYFLKSERIIKHLNFILVSDLYKSVDEKLIIEDLKVRILQH
jgi:hypothetical protein